MRRWLAALALLVCLGAQSVLGATGPGEMLGDPALEQRARALSQQLRCLVCQNQSIDDSDADLARDLRRLVRERIAAGDSDQEIIAYLTARYGDFILLKPPVKPATWGLWFGPASVLVIAGGGLLVYLRRRRGQPGVTLEALSHEERARLEVLASDRAGPNAARRQASSSVSSSERSNRSARAR